MVINFTINVLPCFKNTLLCSKAREMNMHAYETPIIKIKGPFFMFGWFDIRLPISGKTYRFESLDCNTYNIHFARKSSKTSLVLFMT
jgi:hypothetical protein